MLTWLKFFLQPKYVVQFEEAINCVYCLERCSRLMSDVTKCVSCIKKLDAYWLICWESKTHALSCGPTIELGKIGQSYLALHLWKIYTLFLLPSGSHGGVWMCDIIGSSILSFVVWYLYVRQFWRLIPKECYIFTSFGY